MDPSCAPSGTGCAPVASSSRNAPSPSMVNSKVMVVAVAVLFFVVIFILCLHIYAKWFWRHHATVVASDGTVRTVAWSRRRARGAAQLPSAAAPQSVGLERAAVEALPSFEYSRDAMKDGLECAVCLEEFEQGERGRSLPRCGHHFHLACIDMWLQSHSTCPLCRTSVLADDAAAKAESESDSAMGTNTVVQIVGAAPTEGAVGASSFMAAMRASRRQQRAAGSPSRAPSLPRSAEDQVDAGDEPAAPEPESAADTRAQPSLKELETPSARGGDSRPASSGVRAPFQVTIDIPRSGGVGAGINASNSATVMSPMARASASFRRLLSRGKSVVTPHSDDSGPSSSPRPPSPSPPSPPPPSV